MKNSNAAAKKESDKKEQTRALVQAHVVLQAKRRETEARRKRTKARLDQLELPIARRTKSHAAKPLKTRLLEAQIEQSAAQIQQSTAPITLATRVPGAQSSSSVEIDFAGTWKLHRRASGFALTRGVGEVLIVHPQPGQGDDCTVVYDAPIDFKRQ